MIFNVDIKMNKEAEKLKKEQDAEKLKKEHEADKLKKKQEGEKLKKEQEVEKWWKYQEAEILKKEQETQKPAPTTRRTSRSAAIFDILAAIYHQDAKGLKKEHEAEKLKKVQEAEKLKKEQEAEKLKKEQEAEKEKKEQEAEILKKEQEAQKPAPTTRRTSRSATILAVLFSIYATALYLKSSPGRATADQIIHIQKSLCGNFYKEELGLVNLEPWKEKDKNSENMRYIQEVYINQVFYNDKKHYTSLLDFFTWKPTENPRRLLLVAEQGAGKTTSIKAMAAKWCRIIASEPKYGYILTFRYAIEYLYNQGWIWVSWQSVVNKWPIFMSFVEYMPLIGVIDSYFGRGTFKQTLDYFKHKPQPLPELVFAFELRNIYQYKNLTEAIIGEMMKIDEKIFVKEEDIEKIFERGMKNILLVFDGYDEYIKLKNEGTTMTEVDSIIHRELRKNVNLIVTTRSWRSDELLTIKRFGFEKISVAPFELPKDRDAFIGHFFPGASGRKLINALDNDEEEVIPKQLQKEPRMLLYICNLWKYNKEIRKSKLKNRHIFWDGIWELMRLTYNRKYPHQEMSKLNMELTRRKIGHLALQNGGKEMTFESFFADLGDEIGFDLFWFGIYGTETFAEKPWELLDSEKETKKLKDVKANYDSMMEEEAEKLKEERSGFVTWISDVIQGLLY